jgi:hypothetical protein
LGFLYGIVGIFLDISEERSASVFRVTEAGSGQPDSFNLVQVEPDSLTVNMEELSTTRCRNSKSNPQFLNI